MKHILIATGLLSASFAVQIIPLNGNELEDRPLIRKNIEKIKTAKLKGGEFTQNPPNDIAKEAYAHGSEEVPLTWQERRELLKNRE